MIVGTNSLSPGQRPRPPGTGPIPDTPEGPLEKVALKAAEAVGAVGMGLLAMMANAAAGGAEGLVHGAGVERETRQDLFQVALATNLMVSGALTAGASGASGATAYLSGAVANLVQGEALWNQQPQKTRDEVAATSHRWVDATLARLGDHESALGWRIASAAVGEVVGLAAGALVGLQSGLASGSRLGSLGARRLSALLKAEH